MAEWVHSGYLTANRPADPSKTATAYERIISGSDDFKMYRTQFAKAAHELIDSNRCTEKDFENMGGWTKSTTTYRDQPVYFIYCGKMIIENRLYLDVRTGRIFK